MICCKVQRCRPCVVLSGSAKLFVAGLPVVTLIQSPPHHWFSMCFCKQMMLFVICRNMHIKNCWYLLVLDTRIFILCDQQHTPCMAVSKSLAEQRREGASWPISFCMLIDTSSGAHCWAAVCIVLCTDDQTHAAKVEMPHRYKVGGSLLESGTGDLQDALQKVNADLEEANRELHDLREVHLSLRLLFCCLTCPRGSHFLQHPRYTALQCVSFGAFSSHSCLLTMCMLFNQSPRIPLSLPWPPRSCILA